MNRKGANPAKRFFAILFALLLTGCASGDSAAYEQITQEGAKEMMDTMEVLILDVREQVE